MSNLEHTLLDDAIATYNYVVGNPTDFESEDDYNDGLLDAVRDLRVCTQDFFTVATDCDADKALLERAKTILRHYL